MRKLLTILAIVIASCNNQKQTAQPLKKDTVIFDLNNTFIQKEGDSIYWDAGLFVMDSTDKNSTKDFKYGYGHHIKTYPDKVLGLKHVRPVVIITDGTDTERHWYGDTLRYTTCPKPKAKSTSTNIDHADVVNIGQ